MGSTVYTHLIGHTMRRVERGKEAEDHLAGYAPDWLEFERDDGRRFRFYHEQDCCELVTISDICGDLADLVGSPMLQAEGVSAQKETEDGSATWTFYKFATLRGSVTVRWVGQSNGYYSESVDFAEFSETVERVDLRETLRRDATTDPKETSHERPEQPQARRP